MSRCFVLDLFILELSNLKGLLVLIAQAPKAVWTLSREVVSNIRASRHTRKRHDLSVAPRLSLVASRDQDGGALFAERDARVARRVRHEIVRDAGSGHNALHRFGEALRR